MTLDLTRRHAGIAALATALTAGQTRDANADLKALAEAAKAEGGLTWYTGQTDAETAELLGRSFTAEFPGVKVSVIRTTGQVAYQRLSLDIKNKTPQCDVFSTTDISHMPVLREKNQLAEYKPENAANLMPQFAAVSDEGFSYITNATRYFLIYNTKLVKQADSPKNWTDLLDPRWKGLVATGHPAFSGCTGVWCVAMRKLYGWEYFEKLAKNNPRIGRSAVDPVTLMIAGEVKVGLASAASVYKHIDKGNPLGINHPTDGLSLCVTPSAIPVNAPHWLRNHDNVSITASLNFTFKDALLANAYRANYVLRKCGLHPLAPGTAPVRDAVKRRAVQAVMSAAALTPNWVKDAAKQRFR